MTKIQVFRTILEAFAFVFMRFGRFWRLAWPAIVGIAVIDTAFTATDAVQDFDIIFRIVLGIALLLLLALFAVGWFRICSVPDEEIVAADIFRWRDRQKNVLKLFIEFLLPYLAIISVFFFAYIVSLPYIAPLIPATIVAWIVVLVPQLLFVALCARFSLAFPAASVDRAVELKEAWGWSRGNGWRLFWILVAVPVAVALLSGVVWRLNALLPDAGLLLELAVAALIALLSTMVKFLAVAIGASALSSAYGRLRLSDAFERLDEASA